MSVLDPLEDTEPLPLGTDIARRVELLRERHNTRRFQIAWSSRFIWSSSLTSSVDQIAVLPETRFWEGRQLMKPSWHSFLI